jgi:hypothetical protein
LTTTLATQPDTAVADLVLVRMTLPSKKPPAPSAMREDVGKLLDSGLSAAEFDDLGDAQKLLQQVLVEWQ